MILRKKIDPILCAILFIFHACENRAQVSPGDVGKNVRFTTEPTEPPEYSNTISTNDDVVEHLTGLITNSPQYDAEVETSTIATDGREHSTYSGDDFNYSTSSMILDTTTNSVCKDLLGSVENLAVNGTSNSINVTWEDLASNSGCVFVYNVSWSSNGDYSGYSLVNSNETEFVITGLGPSKSFVVSVNVIGANNNITRSVSYNTSRSQIPHVKNLTVRGIEFALIITWDPPDDTTNLVSYRINVSSKDNETQSVAQVNSSVTTYTFSNLSACGVYNVQVTPVGSDNSDGTTADASGQVSDSVPGAVSNLTAPTDQVTGYSVYLTWLAPTLNADCILYYKVDICLGNNCTASNTTNEFYNATNLDPCLTYTFKIWVVGNVGSSDAASVTAETSYITPGIPASMGVIPGKFSLFIHWEPPTVGGTCVSSYRITLWNSGATVSTNLTNVTMSDLIACKNYTAQIIPVGTSSGDGQLGTISGVTQESVHDPPTLDIEEPEVTKSTISISWHLNRTRNLCELTNVITTCNFTSTEGHGFNMVNGISTDDISGFDISSNVTINITVSSLSPFTWYRCLGVTENIAGYSTSETVVTTRTSEDVPSAPIMEVSDITSSNFTLKWKEPEYLAGILIEHEILLSWKPLFLMPRSCVYNGSSEKIDGIQGSSVQHFYSNATAYSNYIATIKAKTNAGWGEASNYTSFKTSADVPGAVTNLRYLNTTNTSNSDLLDTFIFWELPCPLNGEIESFAINFHGVRDGFEDHTFSQMYRVAGNLSADEIFEKYFGELGAEYNYTFEVSAKVVGISVHGPSTTYNVIYPAGIPPLPTSAYMEMINISWYNAERTSSSASVLLPLFQNTNGEIKYYAIMVAESGTFPEQSRFDVLGGGWPNTTSWQEAMLHTPIISYQATAIRWHPATTENIVDFKHLKAVQFTLGVDHSCSKSTNSETAVSYCNGPLQPDIWYQVRMRAFTNGGYRDSLGIIVRTKAEFNLGLVIGVVFGILFLGLITTMMLLVRKGVLQSVVGNLLHPSLPNTPGPDPFTRKKFELHCRELIENPGKLSNEFQLLQTLSVDLEMSANAAGLQANRKKNRYINILPYDITRVKLDVLNNDPNTDYINASFIQGYSGVTEYIACQGPKEETTYDFWRMVFQYNVKVIVMVTQLVENGKDKCHQYYPNTREYFEHEDITIRCGTQLDFVFYRQRIITLQKGNVTRTITHLHFKEWSDHGVPDDIHSMIHFCQIVRKQMNDNKGIAVIHCSAGVGRTGTLIAIDILLQQIKDNKKLDVFGTVYRLRQHRMNMVQTESQYAYIYNCIKQAVNNPYPLKHYKSPSVEPIYENLTKKNKEITDSNTNLVNSTETLKKISPSPSIDSMDPDFEIGIFQRPIYTTQLSTLSNGLRYSKSTSALQIQLSPSIQMARYGSHEYPIFEPAPDSPSSKCSMDRNSLLDFTRPTRTENTTNHPRFTSCNETTNYS